MSCVCRVESNMKPEPGKSMIRNIAAVHKRLKLLKVICTGEIKFARATSCQRLRNITVWIKTKNMYHNYFVLSTWQSQAKSEKDTRICTPLPVNMHN